MSPYLNGVLLILLFNTVSCIHSTFRYQAAIVLDGKNKGDVDAQVPINTAEFSLCLLFSPTCLTGLLMPYEYQKSDIRQSITDTLDQTYGANKYRLRNESFKILAWKELDYKVEKIGPKGKSKILAYENNQNYLSIDFGILPLFHYISYDVGIGFHINQSLVFRLGTRGDEEYRGDAYKLSYISIRHFPLRALLGETTMVLSGLFVEGGVGNLRYQKTHVFPQTSDDVITSTDLNEETFAGFVTGGYISDSGYGLGFGSRVHYQFGEQHEVKSFLPYFLYSLSI